MEFCEGALISDLKYLEENKINKHDVCRKVGQLYSQMIFVNGYIHCDPHPGNILIHKDEKSGVVKIILLDHGLYKTLEDEFRVDYANLWLALLKPDLNEIQVI
uniref:Protein kinase domain-containing protein n=1 Tax=Acrobeloides nanus TaxID=290746 RepID=A0A914DU58_9BILA